MRIFKFLSIGLFFLSMFFTVNAQTEKGNILLGGGTKLSFTSQSTKLEFNGQKRDGDETNEFEFSPQIGYFVVNGLALGLEFPIKYSYQKSEFQKMSTTTMAIAPFLRYYFGSTNIKPYLHGQAGFGNVKFKSSYSRDDQWGNSDRIIEGKSDVFLYQLGAGVGVFLNKKVALDFGVAYSSGTNYSNESKTTTSGFGVGVGIVVVL